MRRLLPAVIAAICMVCVGCGTAGQVTHRVGIPARCTSLGPPCSAITPEGARGADRTRYLNGKPPVTLIGGQIHIDAAGLSLTAAFENVYEARYCPYWDPYGHVYTRGFGETDWSGNFGGVCISHARALANLSYLMETQYLYAVRDLGVNVDHHQIDALADFVWNLGPGSLEWQPLRGQLQRYDPYGMLAYDRAGGVVLAGLRARREDEVRLFLTGEPKPKPKPPSNAQLKAELDGHYHYRAILRGLLTAHRCRTGHAKPARYRSACRVWFRQGAATNRAITALHHRGIF